MERVPEEIADELEVQGGGVLDFMDDALEVLSVHLVVKCEKIDGLCAIPFVDDLEKECLEKGDNLVDGVFNDSKPGVCLDHFGNNMVHVVIRELHGFGLLCGIIGIVFYIILIC